MSGCQPSSERGDATDLHSDTQEMTKEERMRLKLDTSTVGQRVADMQRKQEEAMTLKTELDELFAKDTPKQQQDMVAALADNPVTYQLAEESKRMIDQLDEQERQSKNTMIWMEELNQSVKKMRSLYG